MKTSFLLHFDSIPYFTIEAAKQILGDELTAAGTIPTSLYRAKKAGQIISLKKGVYMTRRFYERNRADPDFPLMVSAILIPRSYLSLEFILQRNGILTDVTHPITAITSAQTRVFENEMGSFTYRNIKNSLYRGYVVSEYWDVPCARATPGKALFDYFYLRPLRLLGRAMDYPLVEDLRLNLDEFPVVDQDEFASFVASSGSVKMNRILENLRKNVWRN
jgi:hypothetical protein